MLARCLEGDQNAWCGFVDRYARVIYASVQRVLQSRLSVGHPVLAEDVVQDVFLRLVRDDFRVLRAFNPKRASLVTYLTVIAHSTTIDALRRKRLVTEPLDGRPEPSVSTQDKPQALELPPGLLSPRQQLVLILLFDKGLSVKEVSAALGIDPQSVRSAKSKAINKLRSHYGHSGGD